MRNLAWLIAVGFFFLNPNFACGTDEAQFHYGAPEMRGAVERDWALTITPAGGPATQVVVHVAQASSASASLRAPPPSHGGILSQVMADGSLRDPHIGALGTTGTLEGARG